MQFYLTVLEDVIYELFIEQNIARGLATLAVSDYDLCNFTLYGEKNNPIEKAVKIENLIFCTSATESLADICFL